MITKEYNPSPLEVALADVIDELQSEISKKLDGFTIDRTLKDTTLDNPIIDLFVSDRDGDNHEVILKVIQKPDVVE